MSMFFQKIPSLLLFLHNYKIKISENHIYVYMNYTCLVLFKSRLHEVMNQMNFPSKYLLFFRILGIMEYIL